MTEVVDPASLIEAAQKAAAAGDFPAAERLLREAAALQESTLGPEHEDLASTLNNLAFMCERTSNIADAEKYYRRAHAIAVASLSPKHPFVGTSIKNLVEFCAAHDIPIWKPPTELELAQEEADRDGDADVPPQPVRAGSWPGRRAIAVAVLCVAAIVAGAFTMRLASRSNSPVPASPPRVVREASAPLEPSAPVEPPAPAVKVERPAPRVNTVAAQSITVLNAQLCKTLQKRGSPDWQCSSPVVRLRQGSGETGLQPGTYFFYTRLLTAASTTVEHRWYRDGRVHQVMRLRITPNPGGGYRTFSSNTISAERAGDWKVELRAADGTILHEERFVIR
jgi:DUF2914 family protein/tetratricopeptide repeat protein